MNKKISIELFINLLLLIFLDIEYYIAITSIVVIINILLKKKLLFNSKTKSWVFLVIGILGFIMSFFYSVSPTFYERFRYIYYIFSIFLSLEYGLICVDKYGIDTCLRTFYYSGIVSLGYYYFQVLAYSINNGFNFINFRICKNYFSELAILSLFIYILFSKNDNIFAKKQEHFNKLIVGIYIITIMLSGSRYLLVDLLMGMTIVFFINKKYKKTYKAIMVLFIALLAGFLIVKTNDKLSTYFDYLVEEIEHSFDEVSSSNKNWTDYEINNDWRGYEIMLEKKQFESSSLIQKLFGTGLKGVYAGKYTKLVSDDSSDYLSHLHNGYYTILMYSGIIGLILYVFFLLNIMVIGWKKIQNSKYASLLLLISFFIIFESFVITGIIVPRIHSVSELIIISILCSCIYSNSSEKKVIL